MGKSISVPAYSILTPIQNEFITLLLPLPSKKLQRTVPSLLAPTSPNGTPALGILAHTIYQTLEFDKAVRGEGYVAVGVKDGKETGDEEEVEEWKGVSQVILGKKEWFDAWLDGERRCTCVIDIPFKTFPTGC